MLKKMVMKAFHYLLKDDGNPEVSNPISLKYATQIIIIICYENKDWLILRLFCYKNQIIFLMSLIVPIVNICFIFKLYLI